MANQNVTQLTQQSGSASASSLFYAAVGATDTGLPLSVFVNNLGLTGVPTVPTAAPGTNTTQIASCAYVATSYAPLASPTFSGTISGFAAINLGGAASFASIQSTPIGTTAAAAGNFTTLTNSGTFTVNGAISGPGITAMFASPSSIGFTTPASGAFTTISATGTITPNQTSGIVGTTTNNNANAGSIGEYISSTILVGSAVSLTSGTPANVTSISLTAGDWDVWGTIATSPAGTTTQSVIQGCISTTSATFPAAPGNGAWALLPFNTGSAGQPIVLPLGTGRISVSTTTTVYLVIQSTFGVSTDTGYGFIGARRRR
jgi:hypothetical protein